MIGEITGRERPEEIVLVGCHFDSWDAATGASDNAVGCIATWEGLRLMKKLGIQPRRTVRLVLFTNEENGLRGGNAYKDAYASDAEKHVWRSSPTRVCSAGAARLHGRNRPAGSSRRSGRCWRESTCST